MPVLANQSLSNTGVCSGVQRVLSQRPGPVPMQALQEGGRFEKKKKLSQPVVDEGNPRMNDGTCERIKL